MIIETLYQLPLSGLKKSGNSWNFRCNICNDSVTNRFKKRAWIYEKKGNYFFHCFNCGTSHTYRNFVHKYFPDIHKTVVKSSFKNQISETEQLKTISEAMKTYSDFPLISCDKLDKDHKAYKYLQERKIPLESFSLIHYAEEFVKFTNQITNNKHSDWKFEDSRIVLPFRKRDKTIFAYQGREIEEGFLRYLTVKIDNDHPKIFGIERIKWDEKVVVVEGPLDSLFIESNGIAFGGADLSIENLLKFFSKDQLIICMDNEKRNKEINHKIERFLQNGFSVCLWPDGLANDINDNILNGVSISEINKIIRQNAVSGKLGLLKFTKWRIK